MKNLMLLDCTLRDGGYVNDWAFGNRVISSIIDKLENADIDIIECGFLTEKTIDENYSLYSDLETIEKLLKNKKYNAMLVGMIAIGEKEIDPNKLPDCNGKSIQGIRLTFHQHEIEKAFDWAKIIIKKGYKVFIQPVGTATYSDLEILQLVNKVNELKPFALYIVDTLGSMYKNELLHTFYLLDKNLNSSINIGFHAHNNLQLAFSNAQELTRIQTKRDIIIDASVFGMGRAAGNLPTELIAEYINKNIKEKYDVTSILDIYDEYISIIQKKYDWGYKIPYHIAASNICHPNYASFLMNKQTLTINDIEKIIKLIPEENKGIFSKNIINDLYINYQNRKIDDKNVVEKLIRKLEGKNVLILAPGKTLVSEKEKIRLYIKEQKPYIISVNFIDESYPIDLCFASNNKRIDKISKKIVSCPEVKVLFTSNIKNCKIKNVEFVNYDSYINDDEIVFDNSGLMLLKLLTLCHMQTVTLAGFDGFQTRYDENYFSKDLTFEINEDGLSEKQKHMRNVILELKKKIEIRFLTKSIYQ